MFFVLYLQFRYICLRLLENKMAKCVRVCVWGEGHESKSLAKMPRRGQKEKQAALKEAGSSCLLISTLQSASSKRDEKRMSREGTALPEATQ